MTMKREGPGLNGRCGLGRVTVVVGVTAVLLGSVSAWAQAGADTTRQAAVKTCTDGPVQTIYLSNVSQVNDANELVTAIRNMVRPDTRVYLVPSQNAILIRCSADEVAIAQKIVNDLDRPRKNYRLTYTLTEMDGGKRIGTQHFSLMAASGQRTTLKQGSKIPVVTGSFTSGTATTQTQNTYLDIGMNFDATPTEVAGGAMLKTKVEQSSIAEEKSGMGAQDPVVRQTVLEGTTMLALGKPLILGSIDLPGSTRHLDVEVMMEIAK
jgi:type II secretory pathway component GspD/PulD (secretin)